MPLNGQGVGQGSPKPGAGDRRRPPLTTDPTGSHYRQRADLDAVQRIKGALGGPRTPAQARSDYGAVAESVERRSAA